MPRDICGHKSVELHSLCREFRILHIKMWKQSAANGGSRTDSAHECLTTMFIRLRDALASERGFLIALPSRELSTHGIMEAGHAFAKGDQSIYRFTEYGWRQREDLLHHIYIYSGFFYSQCLHSIAIKTLSFVNPPERLASAA
jgi:hypothetical protein